MTNPALDIRIGTLVKGDSDPAGYIRQILPHGFESFQITFWRTLGDVDLPRLADDVRAALDGHDAVISSVGIYGNTLENDPLDHETRQGWERLIDHAHLFGTDIVAGFTGRLRDQSIDASIPCFKEFFEPLAHRAAERGVRIAFENCAMDGTWQRVSRWRDAVWPVVHTVTAFTIAHSMTLCATALGLVPCHHGWWNLSLRPPSSQPPSTIFGRL